MSRSNRQAVRLLTCKLGRRVSSLLLYRLGAFININSVLSQLSWDTWRVGRLPSEDIFVVMEKVGEREVLFFREVGTDGRRLGGITGAQVDLLDICLFWWGKDVGPLSRDL